MMGGSTRPTSAAKHVWLVNHHALIPSKDSATGRHVNMARHLPQHGWSASLIVASTVHADGSQGLTGLRLRRMTSELGVPTLWIRSTAYGASLLRRFLGMGVFAAGALVPGMTRGLQKPDVVVGSTVHLLAAWVGARYARRFRVPFVFEVRDVWPDSLVHLGRLNPNGRAARAMEWFSLRLARRADLLLSPLPAMDRYLVDHEVTGVPFLWVSNGIAAPPEPTLPALESRSDEFTFMYLGSLNRGNAIEDIIEGFAFACERETQRRLTLRIVGSGPQQQELEALAEGLGVAAEVTFEGRIPQDEVIDRARQADCLVANLRASPLYDYGVSLNKLFMYMSAGRPIVFGASGANDPVAEAAAGISARGGDPGSLAAAMVQMIDAKPEERQLMGRNGYEAVTNEFTYEALAAKLARGLDGTLAGRAGVRA